MKQRSIFIATVLTILLIGCEKEEPLTGAFKAKYLGGMCGQNIIEILDSNYYDRGIDWTSSTGQSLKHVFTVQNHCDFGNANLQAGDVFDCVLITSPGKTDCIVCMAYMETPPKSWNIKVVK